MDVGDWISLAGVVIAGGSAIWAASSARAARQAQLVADDRAEAAVKAERAAVAAQRDIAEQLSRSADIEAERARREAEQAESAEGVPWRLAHHRGDLYEARNESDKPKFHVAIDGPKLINPQVAERVDGRSSMQFRAIPAGGLGDEVLISWHRLEDKSDAARTWSGLKLPKPKEDRKPLGRTFRSDR
ncbi:hypothetical protein C6A86_011995 [Mycobacterium sp. ITM-2016-00316]|uniref:hypothetical protein n=1 Tax=Mycobacterium sp. ITM-2016-00316 TaxID=2099695 RepID=UPI000CF8A21A|nr:hypothetical protein [Mycobacterium sp. ITM-2016-00316]WNG84303.1 hypothetical protein C6A86_011995 [Mycobacterium sp. ITM-2016-00316]